MPSRTSTATAPFAASLTFCAQALKNTLFGLCGGDSVVMISLLSCAVAPETPRTANAAAQTPTDRAFVIISSQVLFLLRRDLGAVGGQHLIAARARLHPFLQN